MTIVGLDELKQRVLLLDFIDNSLDEDCVRNRYFEENAKLTRDDNIPFFIRNPASPMPKTGQKLYRVTKDFPGFQESLLSFYKQPPKDRAKQQRCNLPKHPVFYCSDVIGICLFEVIQGISTISNEYFYFSEWEVISDRTWRALSFIFKDIPTSNPAYSYVNQVQSAVINAFAQLMSRDEISAYMDYYHDEFTKLGNHKFSSVVSHQFLYENDQDNGDFVFYPSVQAEKLGNNLAFNKRVIDNGEIVLRKVYKVHISQLTKTTPSSIQWQYALVGVAEVAGDDLHWHKPDQRENNEFDQNFPTAI